MDNIRGEMVDCVLRATFDLCSGNGGKEPCVLELPHPGRWNATLRRVESGAVHERALGGAAANCGPAGEPSEKALCKILFAYYGRRPREMK